MEPEITHELIEACEYMIDITGGSALWHGKTHTALKRIEQAVYRARKLMSIANIGGNNETSSDQKG